MDKKKNCPSSFAITKFFGSSKPYHKNDPIQHAFLEDLMLQIVKGHHFFINYNSAMVETLGFTLMWESCFPIEKSICEWGVI